MPKLIQLKSAGQPEKNFSELLKEREGDDHINKSLQEIYQAENLPAAKGSLHRRSVDPLKRLAWTFVVFLGVLAAVSWSGFYLLHQGERLRTEDVSFAIVGPQEVAVGKEVVYELQYTNLSAFNLRDVQIRLQAPDDFIFLDAAPAPVSDKGLNWRLDQVDTKRSGRIAVKGKVVGLINAQENFSATLSYRPENFSSTFRADASFTTTVNATGISFSIEAPSFINVAEAMPITVRYAKEHESYLDAFSVLLTSSEHFVVSGDNQTGVWLVNNAKETQQELAIKGSYAKKPAGDEKLTVQLAVPQAVVLTHEENGQSVIEHKTIYHVFYEQVVPVVVVDGALSLTLSLNGATAGKPLNFGDALNYVIHYKNVSAAALKNVVIMATVDSALVDWSALNGEHNAERSANSLLWTKAEIPELAGIAPNQEGSFGFSLKVKDAAAAAAAGGDLAIHTALDYSIDSAPVSGNAHALELINQLNTDATFNAQLRYFDISNASVGAGPLPPKVGEKTTYQVYWSAAAGMHDLKNLTVSATLPDGVKWENVSVAGVGAVSYDSGNKTVTWMAPVVGSLDQPALLRFAVSLIPAAGDRGKIITVLNQTDFSATDAATGGVITAAVKPKTTNLEDDSAGHGQGQAQ